MLGGLSLTSITFMISFYATSAPRDNHDQLVLTQVLRSEEELRYIVDGAKPRLAMVVKQSFVVHSPDSSQYKEYLKLGAASNSPHYMPHWTYDELNTVRLELHPGVTDQQVCVADRLSTLISP